MWRFKATQRQFYVIKTPVTVDSLFLEARRMQVAHPEVMQWTPEKMGTLLKVPACRAARILADLCRHGYLVTK